ncbi:hypothetical protein HNQ02_002817 [Flavobacterium sp. 7E]|uniref:hypothetical protein n=1 Tax=Flavobacterium sp. 7E TaxID=2735898 RepID=UPI00156EB864|nr:hypothetical protein [Flavobacterium sp. 7E]NRS89883.1 hypothetical protein [Flavobacterium sp. 7E]
MKIQIILLILVLIGCQNKKKENTNSVTINKNNIENISSRNSLVVKLENNVVYFNDILTTNDTDNVNADYSITKLKNTEILIKGLFLESDLLDGKTLEFLNKNYSDVKIKFYYDIVFNGNEKSTTNLGFTLDTLINLKTSNKKIVITKFDDIKGGIWYKFQKDVILNEAFEIGKSYFGQNESEEAYLSYLNKIKRFKEGNKSLKNLEELSIDIDYVKFEIEFLDEKGINNKIIYDRGFSKNNNLKENNILTFVQLKNKLINYKTKEQVKCDLNKDGLEDLVIVFEPLNNKKANENDRHIVNSPFCVMINQGNGKYLQFENKKIIYTSTFNCPDFVVDKLEVKDNYVILQQGTCDEFDRIIKDNMTFKFNSETNEITLDKYKRSLFERLDKSEFLPLSKTLIAKDFGKVLLVTASGLKPCNLLQNFSIAKKSLSLVYE